jgi:DNA modification methylase
MNNLQIFQGDALERLQQLPSNSVHCAITSPPYFGLRSYLAKDDPLKASEIGAEKTLSEYIENLVVVFRELRRVLREDGTFWLNLGDSYNSGASGGLGGSTTTGGQRSQANSNRSGREAVKGFKPKDLLGMPHRVAFALQADGWYLRAICPWLKRNGMPESCRDRPTQTVEYVFLLTKSAKYFYDAEAVRVPFSESFANDKRHASGSTDKNEKDGYAESLAQNPKKIHKLFDKPKGNGALRRSSRWFFESFQGLYSDDDGEPLAFIVNTQCYKGTHFATFPPKLIEPMILAGTSVGSTVIDPFGGSGTVGEVAKKLGRRAILIELNRAYIPLIEARVASTTKI